MPRSGYVAGFFFNGVLFFFFNDTATTEIYTLPYTTLFRSPTSAGIPPFPSRYDGSKRDGDCRWRRRSEEHTSELQSHHDIVCRLLLEQKTHSIVRENVKNTIQIKHQYAEIRIKH